MTSVPKNSLRFTRSNVTTGYLVFDGGFDRYIGRVTRTGPGWLAEVTDTSAPNGFTVVPAPFTKDGLWSTRSVAADALVAVAAEAAASPVADWLNAAIAPVADPFLGLPR